MMVLSRVVNRMETAGLTLPRHHTSRLRNVPVCSRFRGPALSVSLQSESKDALSRLKLQLTNDQTQQRRISAVVVASSAKTAASSDGKVKVQFALVRECGFGQAFGVVGGSPELGQWDPSSALQMEWSPGHVWSAQTVLPAGSQIEFKFIMVTEGGEVVWQPGPNHTAEISNAKERFVLHLPWDDEELPPLPRSTAAVAAKPASEFQEATLASANTAPKGNEEAEETGAKAVDASEAMEEEAVAFAPRDGGSVQQAREKSGGEPEAVAEENAKDKVIEPVGVTGSKASPPEPYAREGTKPKSKPSPKQKSASPTVRVLQADAAWGQRVWGSLIGTWGRKSLMDEETDRQ